jgi:hypothetical protein
MCFIGTRPYRVCQRQAGRRPCVRRSHRGRGGKGCCHEDLGNLVLLPQQRNLYWRLPILILGRQGHVRESLQASARGSFKASARESTYRCRTRNMQHSLVERSSCHRHSAEEFADRIEGSNLERRIRPVSKEDSCYTAMSFCSLYRTERHRVQGHTDVREAASRSS